MAKLEEIWNTLLDTGMAHVPTSVLSRQKEKILTIIFPRQLPGWRIEVRLSHTKYKFAHWLITKAIFQKTSKREGEILRILGSQLPDGYYILIKFILSSEFSSESSNRRQQTIPIIQKNFPSFPRISRDYLLSFHPREEICKVWTKRKSLKPIRFVGVGYNDHGHLSSLPSWKDQILYTDNSDLNVEVHNLLDSLRLSFRLSPIEWQLRHSSK